MKKSASKLIVSASLVILIMVSLVWAGKFSTFAQTDLYGQFLEAVLLNPVIDEQNDGALKEVGSIGGISWDEKQTENNGKPIKWGDIPIANSDCRPDGYVLSIGEEAGACAILTGLGGIEVSPPGGGGEESGMRYTCANDQCRPDPNGQYKSEKGCIDNCLPPFSRPPRWKCENDQCIEDLSGSYTSEQDCLDVCGVTRRPPAEIGWSCNAQTGQCAEAATNRGGTYPTQGDCDRDCNIVPPQPLGWSCLPSGGGNSCQQVEGGDYSGYMDCYVDCQPPNQSVGIILNSASGYSCESLCQQEFGSDVHCRSAGTDDNATNGKYWFYHLSSWSFDPNAINPGGPGNIGPWSGVVPSTSGMCSESNQLVIDFNVALSGANTWSFTPASTSVPSNAGDALACGLVMNDQDNGVLYSEPFPLSGVIGAQPIYCGAPGAYDQVCTPNVGWPYGETCTYLDRHRPPWTYCDCGTDTPKNITVYQDTPGYNGSLPNIGPPFADPVYFDTFVSP